MTSLHVAPAQLTDPPAPHPNPPAGNGQLKPITLVVLALLSSPLFLVSIPLAHIALAQTRHHPGQARAAKVLATIALALSYLGIVLITLLAARHTRH